MPECSAGIAEKVVSNGWNVASKCDRAHDFDFVMIWKEVYTYKGRDEGCVVLQNEM